MKCGYCSDQAVAILTATYIRHPKPTPVCQTDLDRLNKPDNFDKMPTVTGIERVWCENPAHSSDPHYPTMTGRYTDADSAAKDPNECHWPHLVPPVADLPDRPEGYYHSPLG
jgi:hypothetical protein